jgi:hypothetical protein
VPQTGCRQPAQLGKGTVAFKDLSPDKKDGFNWKYGKGPNNPLIDYGSPLTTTNYWVCVYDTSLRPQPLMLMHIPAGGTCGTKPCWKTIKGGFKYNKLLFRGHPAAPVARGVPLKSKIQAKGKGDNLPQPTLPLTTTVTVQIKNSLGTCWENTFDAPIRTSRSSSDRSPPTDSLTFARRRGRWSLRGRRPRSFGGRSRPPWAASSTPPRAAAQRCRGQRWRRVAS